MAVDDVHRNSVFPLLKLLAERCDQATAGEQPSTILRAVAGDFRRFVDNLETDEKERNRLIQNQTTSPVQLTKAILQQISALYGSLKEIEEIQKLCRCVCAEEVIRIQSEFQSKAEKMIANAAAQNNRRLSQRGDRQKSRTHRFSSADQPASGGQGTAAQSKRREETSVEISVIHTPSPAHPSTDSKPLPSNKEPPTPFTLPEKDKKGLALQLKATSAVKAEGGRFKSRENYTSTSTSYSLPTQQISEDLDTPRRGVFDAVQRRSSFQSIADSSEGSDRPDRERESLRASSESHGHQHGGKNKFPEEITAILQNWLYSHLDHPFPTEQQKEELVGLTNLTKLQISNWFVNSRRRRLRQRHHELSSGDATSNFDPDAEHAQRQPSHLPLNGTHRPHDLPHMYILPQAVEHISPTIGHGAVTPISPPGHILPLHPLTTQAHATSALAYPYGTSPATGYMATYPSSSHVQTSAMHVGSHNVLQALNSPRTLQMVPVAGSIPSMTSPMHALLPAASFGYQLIATPSVDHTGTALAPTSIIPPHGYSFAQPAHSQYVLSQSNVHQTRGHPR